MVITFEGIKGERFVAQSPFDKIAKKSCVHNMRCIIKMFLKPVWEGKIHGLTKIGIFVHCFVSTCLANQPTTVLELGLSVSLFEPNRTI